VRGACAHALESPQSSTAQRGAPAPHRGTSQDGGGSIDAKELKDLMASVGQNPTDDELAEMIRIADADGTGARCSPRRGRGVRRCLLSQSPHPHAAAGDIDFAEFVTLMAHKMADEKSEATLKAAFSVFDTSGDGFISAEEMRRIMINVGEPVTLDDVEQVIRKVDIDGDGVINYEEFTKVIIEEKATQFGPK
jgi:Ca2+-binding EF-hand superfamily protein